MHIAGMIDFAEPAGHYSRWLERASPALPSPSPPAPVLPTLVAPPRSRWRRMRTPVAAVTMCAFAFVLVAQIPGHRPVEAGAFAGTRAVVVAERSLRQILGPAPRLSGVRRVMATAQLYCRDAVGEGADSLLVCLGDAVRFGEAYSRMTFRFVSTGDSVVQTVVCPALVTLRRTTPPAPLLAAARPSLRRPGCWRDPADPTHAEWTYAGLPGVGKFTTVPEPDAPRMRAESAPAADTVLVLW
jgi:hypothetical protein